MNTIITKKFNIALLIAGLILGVSFATLAVMPAPQKATGSDVLGHRIGPDQQLHLVYAK